jgi:hypothetical protein
LLIFGANFEIFKYLNTYLERAEQELSFDAQLGDVTFTFAGYIELENRIQNEFSISII